MVVLSIEWNEICKTDMPKDRPFLARFSSGQIMTVEWDEFYEDWRLINNQSNVGLYEFDPELWADF